MPTPSGVRSERSLRGIVEAALFLALLFSQAKAQEQVSNMVFRRRGLQDRPMRNRPNRNISSNRNGPKRRGFISRANPPKPYRTTADGGTGGPKFGMEFWSNGGRMKSSNRNGPKRRGFISRANSPKPDTTTADGGTSGGKFGMGFWSNARRMEGRRGKPMRRNMRRRRRQQPTSAEPQPPFRGEAYSTMWPSGQIDEKEEDIGTHTMPTLSQAATVKRPNRRGFLSQAATVKRPPRRGFLGQAATVKRPRRRGFLSSGTNDGLMTENKRGAQRNGSSFFKTRDKQSGSTSSAARAPPWDRAPHSQFRGTSYRASRIIRRKINPPGTTYEGDVDDFFKEALGGMGVHGGGQDRAFAGGPPVSCTVAKATTRNRFLDNESFFEGFRRLEVKNRRQLHSGGASLAVLRRFRPNQIQNALSDVVCFYGVLPAVNGRSKMEHQQTPALSLTSAPSSKVQPTTTNPSPPIITTFTPTMNPPSTTMAPSTVTQNPTKTTQVSTPGPTIAGVTATPSIPRPTGGTQIPSSITTASLTSMPTAAPAVPTATPMGGSPGPTLTPTSVTVAPTSPSIAGTTTGIPTTMPTTATALPNTSTPMGGATSPTQTPSVSPSSMPTVATALPTGASSGAGGTPAPSPVPTIVSVAPTSPPTAGSITGNPTLMPTVATGVPTATPTGTPTGTPTATATAAPTGTPTSMPTASPTAGAVMTTSAPSTGGTTSPAGTVPVTVQSVLRYSFFDDAARTEPTQVEVDSMMLQTDSFYSSLLQRAFGNFEGFKSDVLNFNHNSGEPFPVDVNFDANALFTEGTDVPSVLDVLSVMQAADYLNYIEMYVWNSEPIGTNVFADTEFVRYGFRMRL